MCSVFMFILNYGQFVCHRLVIDVFVYNLVFWLFICCQYHRNQLPGKTRPQSDLLCDVKLCCCT